MGDDISPLPWVLMAFTSLDYIVYALMTSDWYLFVSSVTWMFCNAFYVVSAIRLAESNRFHATERMLYTLGLSIITMMAVASQMNAETRVFVVGISGSFFIILTYSSPLSVLHKVYSKRSAAAIHLPLTLTSTMNAMLWLIYGLALNDPFLWAPMTVGMVMNVLQIVLKMVYHKPMRAALRSMTVQTWVFQTQRRHAAIAESATQPTYACPICMEHMGPSMERQCIELSCSHVLCVPCASRCSSSGLQSCPVCRHPHLLDPNELHSRNLAWRAEYARWRVGKNRGAVGEISSITAPDGAAKAGGGAMAEMSRLICALDLAKSTTTPCQSERLGPLCAESAFCEEVDEEATVAVKDDQGKCEC